MPEKFLELIDEFEIADESLLSFQEAYFVNFIIFDALNKLSNN